MESLENIIVSKVLSSVFLEYSRDSSGNAESRSHFGISFCAKGHITFLNGDREIELTPGCAVLLPQGSKYSWVCHKNGLYPQINFKSNTVLSNEIVKFDLGGYTAFDSKLHDLQNALLTDSAARAMSILYDIIDNIIKKSKPGNHFLSKAIDCIHENYSDVSLSNGKLASLADISEVYFRKLFKDAFGTTPKQYILDLRIKKAEKLLLESQHNVSEISDKCGFSSVYHFCRAFKNATSLTPTEYARLNRSNDRSI